MSSSLISMQHLMSATEIGELLGVSRQRVDQIAKADPTFPEPVAVLSGVRVWETEAVTEWARGKGRIDGSTDATP